MHEIKIGIIGCGVISDIYLANMKGVFDVLDVGFVADRFPEKAKEKAEQYGIPKWGTVPELLADDSIRIVVNLTTPLSHYQVAKDALLAGKNVYTEKPLGIDRVQGRELVDLAAEKGLLIGGAPDTFLGSGLQACRRAIDDGLIGKIVGATATFTHPGHETWHPSPRFFYQKGGGPVLDVGPYYITALVNLIGPVASVAGHARKTYEERTITSKPLYGTKIPVDVPTHYSSSLEFEDGALATTIFSFDVWGTTHPFIEIYGSKGSLNVPDPNTFDGPVRFLEARKDEWVALPVQENFRENSRGLGVADMAYAMLNGRTPRANGNLTYHVLDVMEGMDDAARQGRTIVIESTCERPKAMPLDASPKGWD
jgi:predicted dehydrogenase